MALQWGGGVCFRATLEAPGALRWLLVVAAEGCATGEIKVTSSSCCAPIIPERVGLLPALLLSNYCGSMGYTAQGMKFFLGNLAQKLGCDGRQWVGCFNFQVLLGRVVLSIF